MYKSDTLYQQSILIKQLPKATAFLNSNLEFVFVSDSWLTDFEIQDSNIIGKNIFETSFLFNEKDIKQLDDYTSEVKDSKHILLWDKHTNKWTKLSCTSWFNEDQKIIGLIIQAEDSTEKTVLNQKVNKLESLLNELTAMSKIGLWEYNIVEDELFWHTQNKKIFEVDEEYTPELESTFEFYKHGHNRNTLSMAIFNATNEGKSWKEKLEIITNKGTQLWVTSTGKAIYEKGKIVSLIGTTQDVTEQVESQSKIIESEQLLRTLIDNLPLNVYIKDLDSKKILVNKSELNYYGYTDENKLLGKDDFAFLDKESAEMCRQQDLYVIKSLNPVLDEENTVYRKDGSQTSFLTSKIPLHDSIGNVTGLIGFSLDITNLKEKETELRNLINITSLQNKKLVNFSHIISHNLRSHSANFSMLLNFLKDEKNENEKKRIEGMLINSSNDLLETLDNLNEVVAINTIETGLDKKIININKKVKEVEKKLSILIRKYNVTIDNKIPHTTSIKAIPDYFENMLTNLFTNAINYKSPDRKPIIKTYIKESGKGVILCIEDNGMGMNLEKCKDKLFGLNKTFHNNKDSKGVGLFLNKTQMEVMDGEITVDSKVGIGTTFNLHFNEKN